MRTQLKAVSAFVVGAFGGLLAGCVTYDFEPVDPLAVAQTTQAKTVIAKQAKPNLMLLVDKSGSMDLPTNVNDPNCPANCGINKQLCPANCPTRWSELQKAMQTFLSTNGKVARMGMTAYPVDNSCGAPNAVRIPLSNSSDVDAELQGKANEINSAIQAISSAGAAGSPNGTGGGTPTGLALRMLGGYDGLADPAREDFILVLTDGLPNCNPNNVNNCSVAAACKCTLAGGACGSAGSTFCTLGCLDKGGSVAEVTALRSKNIRTIVVGFGADTQSGDGPDVLNAMAEAGGFARSCNTAGCAKYYQAGNAAELAAALAQIAQAVGSANPCLYTLEASPSDQRFLSVLIDGTATAAGSDTWTFDPSKAQVTFVGALCRKVSDATPTRPVRVEFRIVQAL